MVYGIKYLFKNIKEDLMDNFSTIQPDPKCQYCTIICSYLLVNNKGNFFLPTMFRFYQGNPYTAERTAKIFFSFPCTTGAAIWTYSFVVWTGNSRDRTFPWSEIQSITVCNGHQQGEKGQPSHLEKKIQLIKVNHGSLFFNTFNI